MSRDRASEPISQLLLLLWSSTNTATELYFADREALSLAQLLQAIEGLGARLVMRLSEE
jgi:hypothetical protein